MNIHEYQAKELLAQNGVPVPKGRVAATPDEAEAIARQLGAESLVIKAQIHAGGRGKGRFKHGFEGGVHVHKSPKETRELAGKMLGQTLVTHQTGEAGRLVSKVLVAEARPIARELYLAVTLDRATSRPVVIASTEGGVNIEDVAEKTPDKIIRISIDPLVGLRPYQARNLARMLQIPSEMLAEASALITGVYKTFIRCSCTMVEINPMAITTDGHVMALDAKINFDDNALFRHEKIMALRDVAEEDPAEVEASKHNLSYIKLNGNIACLVNGAGLAMATMDIIKHYGGEPANFLDVGGSANQETVTEAFKIILSDKKVKGILVNIFGGIMKCDVIANGIVAAVREIQLSVPLVVRLEGTNSAEGKKIIRESGLNVIGADGLAEAAEKIVKAVS
jgi:succinyl-CoA synthetase beta subunit